MNDRPTIVPAVAKPSEMEKALEDSIRNMEVAIKLHTQIAKLRRAAYESYLKEGFTPDQALILCKG